MEIMAAFSSPPQVAQATPAVGYSTSSRARKTERLWKEFFKDPSQWQDNRESKTNPRAPDFKHKLTRESLWMDGWDNPSWVHVDMLRLERAEEPCAIQGTFQAQQGVNNNRDGDAWAQMLSLEKILDTLEAGVQPQPSVHDFICILCRCRQERNLSYALRLNAYMRQWGLEAHQSLGNYVIPMLAEVGCMSDAQKVFDRLEYRNEYSWTCLITGYIKCGEAQHALFLFQKMQEDDSVQPNGYTFVAVLKACTNLKDMERGREIHAEIAITGLLDKDLFVGNTLVDMYAKNGLLAKAQEVFDKLPVRDVVSWNALAAGYAQHGHGEEALNCFKKMQIQGTTPDVVSYICILKACGSIGATENGQETHAEIAKKGLLERDSLLGDALLDMYAKCGLLAEAQEVFDRLVVRDVVSWTALMAGYADHGHGEEALNLFEQMQIQGISPNAITFVCSLKACGNIGATDKGQEIHAQIDREGLLERHTLVGSTLVVMYAKCGLLAKAQKVFDKLTVRDVVPWTALISGYAEHGHDEEALNCYNLMQKDGVFPDAVTYVCILKACGGMGATDKGREIHADMAKKGLLESDHPLGNSLVDFYAKCGSFAEAQEVFDKLLVRDVVSWTTLIAGYAQRGESEMVFHTFDRMTKEGVKPNLVTFVAVVNACCHAGLVDKGETYFNAMRGDYDIIGNHIQNLPRPRGADSAGLLMRELELLPPAEDWSKRNLFGGPWAGALELYSPLDEKNSPSMAFGPQSPVADYLAEELPMMRDLWPRKRRFAERDTAFGLKTAVEMGSFLGFMGSRRDTITTAWKNSAHGVWHKCIRCGRQTGALATPSTNLSNSSVDAWWTGRWAYACPICGGSWTRIV